jgi:hypothetical protein
MKHDIAFLCSELQEPTTHYLYVPAFGESLQHCRCASHVALIHKMVMLRRVFT